jgi:hypothetical protein
VEFTGTFPLFSFSAVPKDPSLMGFHSLRGRFLCFAMLMKEILLFPWALFCRACVSFFRLFVLVCATFCLLVTLGLSDAARDFWIRRVFVVVIDALEWVILPVVAIAFVCKLLVAAVLHPALYFRSY